MQFLSYSLSFFIFPVDKSFVGALLGCIPARSFGKYMFNQYAEFFSLPSPIYIDPVSTKLKGFLIAAFASFIAVIFGVGGIVKIQAAEAMRAATPKVNNNFSFGFIKNFNAELAIISCKAINTKGIFEGDDSQGLVKKSMIENANKAVLLCDNTKEEAGGFFKLSDFRDIDALVSNGNFSPELDEILANNIKRII